MNNIAEQLKATWTDTTELMSNAELDAKEVNQDWENESTEYDFIDGSVLIVNNNCVYAYASR